MSVKTLTVLFADLANSTRLYQTRGDTSAHRAVSQSLECMRDAIESHAGQLLRTVGDASLASFESTDAACEAAMRMQLEHVQLGLQIKVGFHFGEVIPDSGDVYGNAVNLAARVADYAQASEICTTEQALARLSSRYRTHIHFLDNVEFKGMESSLPVYRVNWRSDNASTVIVTSAPDKPQPASGAVLKLELDGRHVLVNSNNPKITFGRAMDNDIVIEAESASRVHASIEYTRGRFMLSDSSTNGTYLLKKGSAMEFLRREAVILDHQGMIGLGFDPQVQSELAIKYLLES